MRTNCIFCGSVVEMVHVHGHYQCPVCKTNALPCCDGDNCSNFLLANAGQIQSENPGFAEKSPQNIIPEGNKIN